MSEGREILPEESQLLETAVVATTIVEARIVETTIVETAVAGTTVQTTTTEVTATEVFVAKAPRPANIVFPGLLDTVCSLLSIVVVAVFVLTFIVQPFRIPSESMERTLLVGDFLLVNKGVYAPGGIWSHVLPYKPVERGDIVVFHFPLDPTDHVVKRVIGLPGDRVRLDHARVFVNEQAPEEPYVVYEPSYPDSFRDNFPAVNYTDPGVDTHWWVQMRRDVQNGELVVPPDMYFVLGDNRNHSRDSRYWGFVPRENIVGRPFVIYFSLWQQSTTDIRPLPDDKLGSDKDKWNSLTSFARWDRTFRVVR